MTLHRKSCRNSQPLIFPSSTTTQPGQTQSRLGLNRTRSRFLIVIVFIVTGLSIGCGEVVGDEWKNQGASENTARTDQTAYLNPDSTDQHDQRSNKLNCEELPIITWATFGQGFMSTYCQGCHAHETPNRYGAPITLSFNRLEEVTPYRDLLLKVIAGDQPTMPPGGGVNASDLERLVTWLTCSEEVR